jgi:excisionase family DNA binding protein
MKLIFYDEAAKILGVSVQTLAQAVSRGEITRAGMQGNKQRFIREQVMLFDGVNPRTGNKKRISYNSLSEQEQALWNRYASEAQHPALSVTPVDDEAIRRVVSQQADTMRESIQSEIASSLIRSLQGMLSPKQTTIAR